MITIQSVSHPDKIKVVDAAHYDNVLMKQGDWMIIPDVPPEGPEYTFREKCLIYFMEIKV